MRSYCHHCKLPTEGHPNPEQCITALLVEVARLRAIIQEVIDDVKGTPVAEMLRRDLVPHVGE